MSKLFKYFTHTNSFRYVDILDNVVMSYNNSVHRSIGIEPNNVTKENEMMVWMYLYKDLIRSKSRQVSDIKANDYVRIYKYRNTFDKGYISKFTTEIFKVSEVVSSIPITYKLVDNNNEKLLGTFYKDEL